MKPVELTSLFDRIPVDVKDFTDTHALKLCFQEVV